MFRSLGIVCFALAGLTSAQAPSWVAGLAQSSITTINLNNPDDTMPQALVNEVHGWDVSYSGFAFAPDYSTHGAMIGYGGGGYVADIFCAAAFDLATRKWVPVWTETPPLTYADGSEFSFNAADMPPDAVVFPSNTGKGTTYYFKSQDTTQWAWHWLFTNNPFRTGETARNVPMSAHEYNCGLGIPAGALGTGSYGGLLLGMRTFATINQGLCTMYPFVLDLTIGAATPADRTAWQKLSEIPFLGEGANKLFGNSCWGMTTSYDPVRERALLSWAGGGSARATVAIDMSGSRGGESYAILGNDNTAQDWPYGLARLIGGTDIRIILETYDVSTVKVHGVNLDPAVSASARRIIPIADISGTAPAVGGGGGFAGLSFDWVENAYAGEGAFAVFTVGGGFPKALYWLKPPVNRSEWQTGAWAWEREDLTGDTPIALASECWGRFYWAPKCGVGVWCGDSRAGVQVIRSSKVTPPALAEKKIAAASGNMIVSPNPISGKAVISFKESVASAAVYDMRGVCLARFTPNMKKCTWNAEHASPGVYVISAKTVAGEVLRERVTVIK